MREFQIECGDLLAGAEACARDLLENSNGTSGRVGVRHSSLSKLLGCNWNLEKSIATGTHNSEPLDHLERRAGHRPHLARDASRGRKRVAGLARKLPPKKPQG